MIKIVSERLVIRDHLKSDLKAMHQWMSNHVTMKFLDWKTDSIDQTSDKLSEAMADAGSSNRKKYFFAVERRDSSKIIGEVGFTVLSKNDFGGIAESGYFFIPQYWGQGFASEALITVNNFVFDELKLHKVVAGCDAENRASEKVMLKCGMIKEGEFKQHHFHRGKWCDRLKYGLVRPIF
jgi:[ribosomal protein S5]-alanine N-acetyltransferase